MRLEMYHLYGCSTCFIQLKTEQRLELQLKSKSEHRYSASHLVVAAVLVVAAGFAAVVAAVVAAIVAAVIAAVVSTFTGR